MTPPPLWQDWMTGARFHIRVHPQAREELQKLPPATQLRLRSMLHELAELADLVPFSTEGSWNAKQRPMLQLTAGDVTVRYTISEASRTLTVESVLVESDSDFGRTA